MFVVSLREREAGNRLAFGGRELQGRWAGLHGRLQGRDVLPDHCGRGKRTRCQERRGRDDASTGTVLVTQMVSRAGAVTLPAAVGRYGPARLE